MLDDSDVSWHRHIKAVVWRPLAATAIGDAAVFVSVDAIAPGTAWRRPPASPLSKWTTDFGTIIANKFINRRDQRLAFLREVSREVK